MKYSANAFGISSGLFLAEMSVDRAIAVTYPMKAGSLCTASRATKVTAVTFAVTIITNVQAFFIYKVPDPPNGLLVPNIPDKPWLETSINLHLLVLGTIVPFSIVIVSNTVIIVNIHRAASARKKMQSNPERKSKEANLTAVLLLTSLSYLVCSLPLRFYETLVHYDLSDPYWAARYSFQWWICGEIWHINFAINFYIYFLGGGGKFRKDAREVLFGCCLRKRADDSSMMSVGWNSSKVR
jgi:hypothetical protein